MTQAPFKALAAFAGLIFAACGAAALAQDGGAPAEAQDVMEETVIPEIDGDIALGRRLYMQGVDAGGDPVRAVVQGDLPVDGRQLTCASCHRASGMGSSEGGAYVPPITAGRLFSARKLGRELRNDRFKEYYKEAQPTSFEEDVRKPRLRPAYDAQSLTEAVREGVDPAGRVLGPTMPRYALSERDMANLLAFLTTLSPDWDPGVEPSVLHFATIVSEDVPVERARAMTETMWTFADWMNKDTQTDLERPGFSPYYRSEFVNSYRMWKMHGWTLEGAPETWRAQLEAYYAEQPVFAILGGLVTGRFQPVAAFCNAHRIPCLFPNTELPATEAAEGGYTLYFSRGLELEAEALAAYFAEAERPPQAIRQIAIAGAYGEAPSRAFAAALPDELELETEIVDGDSLAAAITDALGRQGGEVLVIWPGARADAAVAALKTAALDNAGEIYLPSLAIEPLRTAWPETPPASIRLVWRYDRPEAVHPDSYRARAWLRSRRLAIRDWGLQRKTFYTLKLAQFALDHMLSDFHRDYMIEIIEHEVENAYDTGPYPQLALGPGQRFASKGAYIVALSPEAKDGIMPVSDWIVP